MRSLLFTSLFLCSGLADFAQEAAEVRSDYRLSKQQQQSLLWQAGTQGGFHLTKAPVTLSWWQQVSALPIRITTNNSPILSTTATVYSSRRLLMNESMLQLYRLQPTVKGRGVGIFDQMDPRFQKQRY